MPFFYKSKRNIFAKRQNLYECSYTASSSLSKQMCLIIWETLELLIKAEVFSPHSTGESQVCNMDAVIYLCKSIIPVLDGACTKWWLFVPYITRENTGNVCNLNVFRCIADVNPESLESWKISVEGAPTAFFGKDAF